LPFGTNPRFLEVLSPEALRWPAASELQPEPRRVFQIRLGLHTSPPKPERGSTGVRGHISARGRDDLPVRKGNPIYAAIPACPHHSWRQSPGELAADKYEELVRIGAAHTVFAGGAPGNRHASSVLVRGEDQPSSAGHCTGAVESSHAPAGWSCARQKRGKTKKTETVNRNCTADLT
jgi:hypothetical protein